jgi:hypothetical protein
MAENLYGIPTARRRTGKEVIGDIGEGFRSGLLNRDPRFSREQRQEKLTQATLQDAEEIKRALNSNDMRKATDILVDRANLLEGMGESAEDTYALRDMIVSGNAKNALGEIDTFINAATRRGLIQAPSPIESKYVATDAQGRLGTVVPVAGGGTRFEPSTGATAKPVAPTEYGTYTSDGIERYSDGPYAGYSLGKVAEMQRTGQLGKFGDVMPSMTPRAAAPEVRPPMLMTTPPAAGAPDLYAGLSTQEAAIVRTEQNDLRLERERDAAEEERKIAAEEERLSPVQTEAQKANLKRLNELAELRANRITGMETAQQFLDAFRSGEKSSGAGRKALSFLPIGTYTEQGQFDEALDSFAEFAAREKLKASGEIRPTDADVKGAKQALFGIGRDESVNINLLETFIRQQQAAENEYSNLIDARTKGTLQDYIPSIDIPTGGVPSFMQSEGELDKAINRLNALGVTG